MNGRKLIVVASDEEIRTVLHHICDQLAIAVTVVQEVSDLTKLLDGHPAETLLFLPEQLPDGDSWKLSGVFNQTSPPPAFFVYTDTASYSNWASILDAGGLGVITLPFTSDKVREALSTAANSVRTEL